LVSVGQADVTAIAAMVYFYSLEESLVLCCAWGTHPNVLGVKMPNLSTIPVSSAHLFFDASYYFHGGLSALSIPTYGSGYTLAFLQAAAAKIISTPPQKRVCVQPDQVPGPRGLRDVSSGADWAWLIGVVSGCRVGFCHGLREV